MEARTIAGLILLVVIMVAGVFLYQSWNGPLFHTTYKMGDEIKGFPATEISLTICNLTTSPTVLMYGVQDIGGLGIQGEYVILTVAIHNLEGYQIYFTKGSELSNAMDSYTFVLADGAGNHQATPDFYFVDSNKQSSVWEMGILMPNAQEVKTLLPNQTMYGYLYFAMAKNYTPNQLLCIKGYYTNANANPNLAISLKSG